MAHRPKPKYASKDPGQGPWTTCSRCGFIWSGAPMRFQYDYMGGTVPQSLGLLVCPNCEDALNDQQRLLILPTDPPPFRNTRPEIYAVDESGPTQDLATLSPVALNVGSITTFFLDLYDGDPDQGGASVLETLTGSATRTDYAGVMSGSAPVANDEIITVTEMAEGSASVAWAVIFDAATAGNVLGSGILLVPQVVTLYNGAAFAVGALQATLA